MGLQKGEQVFVGGDGFAGFGCVGYGGEEGPERIEARLVFCTHGGFQVGFEAGEEGGLGWGGGLGVEEG